MSTLTTGESVMGQPTGSEAPGRGPQALIHQAAAVLIEHEEYAGVADRLRHSAEFRASP